MNKKTLTMLFLIICVSLTTPIFANDVHTTETLFNNPNVEEISYEEFIESIAESYNVSIEEAIEMDKKDNADNFVKHNIINLKSNIMMSNSLDCKSKGTSKYYTATKRVTYPDNNNYTVEMRTKFKIYQSGSFAEISELITMPKGYVLKGSHNYKFITEDSYIDKKNDSDYPTLYVEFGICGYFEETIQNGVDIGLGIPGFYLSLSKSGYNYYNSGPIDVDQTLDYTR